MVEVNVYYQGYRERTEIDVIEKQKWNMILEIPQLACHNSEIDWRTGEVRMTRYPEKCRKQWRLKQEKSGWQKQKKKERKKQEEKEEKQKKKKKKPKKERKMEVRKVAEEWEIWDEKKEVAKSEEEMRKLVPAKFHKQIYIFRKKVSKQMLTRKLQNHVIDTKEGFVPRKGKVYLLSREE